MKEILLPALLVFMTSTFAYAQAAPVRVAFADGLVTLVANDTLLTDVLAEWSRAGGTEIIGADQLPVVRVTVSMPGVAERDAIDAVLGPIAGYITAARFDVPAGSSQIRRLQIVRKSSPSAPSVQREIDLSIPESQFEYPAPLFDPDTLTANLAGAPKAPVTAEPPVMPELRFQYGDPTATMPMPLDDDPNTKTDPKVDPKNDPRTKKPPSGV
jgi:hypothetical protein